MFSFLATYLPTIIGACMTEVLRMKQQKQEIKEIADELAAKWNDKLEEKKERKEDWLTILVGFSFRDKRYFYNRKEVMV